MYGHKGKAEAECDLSVRGEEEPHPGLRKYFCPSPGLLSERGLQVRKSVVSAVGGIDGSGKENGTEANLYQQYLYNWNISLINKEEKLHLFLRRCALSGEPKNGTREEGKTH